MSIVLDERSDGSLAVYMDGDLQFDSRDERVYHELLALPALALAQQRQPDQPLRALICGGGDGLVARELLKSAAVCQLDLVDYDSAMIELARTAWPDLNAAALADPRLTVQIADAWDVVAQAISNGTRYDLIVCDFTVPQDLAGARLHSIEWYRQLQTILTPQGVLAVNAASPTHVPLAYWSIYNALRNVGLHPRPYRFALASFRAQGYGDDWGFCLAAPRPIQPDELADHLPLATPRLALHDADHLRRCFWFPASVAELRATAAPTSSGSQWLLQALCHTLDQAASTGDWNGLGWQVDAAPLPAPDTGAALLPDPVRQALQAAPGRPVDEQALFERVVALMPALHPKQNHVMISTFLESPVGFLAALDLQALIEALLRRAAALPRRVVIELRWLHRYLRQRWSLQHVLQLGLRVVSIIALVVMLSNLIHPDTVYGKGGGGTNSGPNTALSHTTGGYYEAAPPSYAGGTGFRPGRFGGYAVDETGTYFPRRRYRYWPGSYYGSSWRSYNSQNRPPDPNEGDGLYRLTPETDLLETGEVVIMLTDQASLVPGDEVTTLLDITTGEPLLFLRRDPALVWRTYQELTRQRLGLSNSVLGKQEWIKWVGWLDFAPWQAADEAELANLRKTVAVLDRSIAQLGGVPSSAPPAPKAPIADVVQLMSSIWIANDGSQLIIERPAGLAFLTRTGWWEDPAHTTPISDPYPEAARKVLVTFLKKQINEATAVSARLSASITSARSDLALLQQDRVEYEAIQKASGPNEKVEYGTSTLLVRDALQRTLVDLGRTTQLIDVLEQELAQQPQLLRAATILLQTLDR